MNQLLAGSRADVVIKVFGDDLKTLKATADRIGEVVRDVPGRGDWRVQRVLGLPLLEVIPIENDWPATACRIKPLLEVVEASRVGRFAGKIFEGPRRFDLMLLRTARDPRPGRPRKPAGRDPERRVGPGLGRRNRSGARRPGRHQPRVAGAAGARRGQRSRTRLVGFVRTRVAVSANRCGFPPVWGRMGGQFENFSRAKNRLLFVVPITLAIIFGMLFLMFGDVRYAVAVFAGVPFALIGGVLALWMRGLPFLHSRGSRLHRGRRGRRAQRRGHGQ